MVQPPKTIQELAAKTGIAIKTCNEWPLSKAIPAVKVATYNRKAKPQHGSAAFQTALTDQMQVCDRIADMAKVQCPWCSGK